MAMTAEQFIQGVGALLGPMMQQMQHQQTVITQLLQNIVERRGRESMGRG